MTNQSKWLISAYAIFYCGGVLVPLDYKLTAAGASGAAGALEGARADRGVSAVARDYQAGRSSPRAALETVLVTEAPAGADLAGAQTMGGVSRRARAGISPAQAHRRGLHRLFLGHGRAAQGLRADARELSRAVRGGARAVPFWPGARYLSIIPTNHAIDFMGGFIMPFTGGGAVVHLRTLRPEYIREAFTRYKITYMAVVPLILKNLERGLRERFAALPPGKRRMLERADRRSIARSRGGSRGCG